MSRQNGGAAPMCFVRLRLVRLKNKYLRAALVSLASVVLISQALALPPEGLGHIVSEVPHDPDRLELEHIKAQFIAGNTRSLHASVRLLDNAIERAAGVTFLLDESVAGRAYAMAAIRAARRGVHVIQVIDAVSLVSPACRKILAAMRREGVKVYVFNEFKTPGVDLFRRVHEKQIWAKTGANRVQTLSGGRNKTDHYHLSDETFDLDVKVTLDAHQGEQVYERQFEALFNEEGLKEWDGLGSYSDSDHGHQLRAMEDAAETAEGLFQNEMQREREYKEVDVNWAMFMRNRGQTRTVTKTVEAAFAHAQSNIVFANAYFIPSDKLKRILLDRLSARVSVHGFTNSEESTPHTNVVRLMNREIPDLLYRGMELNVHLGGEVHGKASSVDGRILFVNSANFDYLSGTRINENGWVFDSPELVEQYHKELRSQVAGGRFIDYSQSRQFRSAFQSVIDRCAALLLQPVKTFF